MNTITIWIAAFFTLAVFSFLYKETPLYRFAEHVYVGTASGHLIVTTYYNFIRPTVANDIVKEHQWLLIIPILIGLLIYTRYIPSISYMSRIPMAFWMGMVSGYTLTYFPAPFIGQVTSSFLRLDNINNIIFTVGLLGTLVYFCFTIGPSHKLYPGQRIGSVIGRWTMVIALGAAFGSTVMARFSLLLGRLQFLLGDWLHII